MFEKIKSFFRLMGKNFTYPLIFIAVMWLLFMDKNSVFYLWKISHELEELEKENIRLKNEIKKTREQLKKMDDPAYLEKYAREELFLRKPNEDLYIIDSIDHEKED